MKSFYLFLIGAMVYLPLLLTTIMLGSTSGMLGSSSSPLLLWAVMPALTLGLGLYTWLYIHINRR